MKIQLIPADALIIADVQIDFLPGGALGIASGEKVIPPVNAYIRRFAAAGNPVFLTRDWHPGNHLSFRGHGGVWPPHCVADSPGAAFSPDLVIPGDNKYIIPKEPTASLTPIRAFKEPSCCSCCRNGASAGSWSAGWPPTTA
jgi:nicotinamidase/pyrazinamidase